MNEYSFIIKAVCACQVKLTVQVVKQQFFEYTTKYVH